MSDGEETHVKEPIDGDENNLNVTAEDPTVNSDTRPLLDVSFKKNV